MKQSESIDLLAAALVAAQAEMPPVPMVSTNPFLKNKFASLGSVLKAITPALTKHGLAIVSLPVSDRGEIGLTTRLIHNSGQYIEETVYMPLSDEKGKSLAQVAGSLFSYLRRYSVSAAFRLYTDEDDDGNRHETKAPETEKEPETPKVGPQTEALIKAGLAKNVFEAEGMLRKSTVINPLTPETNVIFWAKKYREVRPDADSETTSEEAAKYADDEYNAEVERRKQDKARPA